MVIEYRDRLTSRSAWQRTLSVMQAWQMLNSRRVYQQLLKAPPTF